MFSRCFLLLGALAHARDIVFPPVTGYLPLQGQAAQQQFSSEDEPIEHIQDGATTPGVMSGLMTFANLPYVHCLKDLKAESVAETDKFDIAFLGAPFDTVLIMLLFLNI